MTLRPHLLAIPLTLVAVLLSGCISLPERGPVVEMDVSSDAVPETASDIDPAPPRKGASRLQIAKGFLDAMTASPIQTNVAREFLVEGAAEEWDPGAATITYTDTSPPQDEGGQVSVELTEPKLLDRAGAWQGPLPAEEQVLAFQMAIEDGEYRIANPRDALIVPASWFEQRFRQVSLYFFDRSARILVPEPVFVPSGEQLATTLIDGLLAGAGEDLQRVSRSFLPASLELELSVPISEDGVANISFLGDAGQLSPVQIERMLAQLAWTLRQDSTINSLRVTIGDEQLRLPGGVSEYAVSGAQQYDPTGFQSSTRLYGLQDGLLVSGDDVALTPADGPLAFQDYGLRSVAVNLAGTSAAGVSADGSSVLLASVRSEAAAEEQPPIERAVIGATNLLEPVWDFTDRVWLVDRTASGARVSYLEKGRRRWLNVPGVTGRQVKAFLVSRDATRIVAVVRRNGTDEIRVGRIEVNDRGVVSRAAPTEPIAYQDSGQVRVQDLAWTSSTQIALLSPIAPGELFEVRTLAVDGAPTDADSLSTTIAVPVSGLAGTPVPERNQYAVTRTGLVDLTTRATQSFAEGVFASVDYVG